MANPRGWSFWVFIALLVLLHFLLHLGLGLGPWAPDLLTVAVLLAARRLPGAVAAAVGLVLGLFQDALSLLYFGVEAVTQTLLGFGGARTRDFFMGESVLFVAGYLFIGKWIHDVVFYLLSRIGSGAETVSRLLVQAPLAGMYAAICGLVALFLYRAVTNER